MDILKNPIIIAIIAGGLTYLYMWWQNKKRQENNPRAPNEEIDYTPPVLVGLFALFIAYNFFGFSENDSEVIEQTKNIEGGDGIKLIEGKPSMHTRFSDKMADSFDSNTYHLIGKNMIKLPQTDVFIDIAKF